MKTLVLFSTLFAVTLGGLLPLIPTTTLIRSPQHDSAIIQSDRVGGNFAYSTVEGHAYQAISPIVKHVSGYSFILSSFEKKN